jgi:15-cis-phytoene synthase
MRATVTWENIVLPAALLGISPEKMPLPTYSLPLISDVKTLQASYQYCARLTALHSKSFFMASGLLSPMKRQAVRALYAFCRTTDDLADFPDAHTTFRLNQWRETATSDSVRFNDAVALAWLHTRQQFRIPGVYVHQLINGVERDLQQNRYESFDDLATYCYAVASTVGLMSMHIIGFDSEKALPYAVKLGIALQMTNILRDIDEDFGRGRIYLPKDEMQQFGIAEEHISRRVCDENFCRFMRFQLDRTRSLYAEALPGIKMLDADGRLAIAAAAHFYQDILRKIEKKKYNVFGERIFVSKWEKMRKLPELLLKY